MTTSPEPSAGGIYQLKPRAGRLLRPAREGLVRAGVTADIVSLASLVAAVLAGVSVLGGVLLTPAIWLLALPFGLIRLALAVLDGEVARATGTCRPAGAFLGEVADRIGDVMILGSLVVVSPVIALISVCTALAADTVVVIAWAITGERCFPGLGGKPDRTLLVCGGVMIGVVVPGAIAWLPPFALLLVLLNLVLRLRTTIRTLRAQARPTAPTGTAENRMALATAGAGR